MNEGSFAETAGRQKQMRITDQVMSISKADVDLKYARAMYANGLPFNLTRDKYWLDAVQSMSEFSKKHKTTYVPPSIYHLTTDLLDKSCDLLENEMGSYRTRPGTVSSDGWSDVALHPILGATFIGSKGSEFLASYDCTGDVKDAFYQAGALVLGAHLSTYACTNHV